MTPRELEPHEIEALAPGIRGAVLWLRQHGFNTTDSGDGSNADAGMEGALPISHVMMTCAPGELAAECNRLRLLLRERNAVVLEEQIDLSGRPGLVILGSYDPVSEVAVIALTEGTRHGYLSKMPRRFCNYCHKPHCEGPMGHRGFDPDFNGA
jgi:hypothetical protein